MTKDGFTNIELYQLMCHVLGIEASPSNGTWDNIKNVLKKNGEPSGVSRGQVPFRCLVLLASLMMPLIMLIN